MVNIKAVVSEMSDFQLVCSRCSSRQPFDLKGKCACGGTLLVEYDLERLLSGGWGPEAIVKRPWGMWRYRELLPVRDENCIVSLGEGGTPLLRLPLLEKRLGIGRLFSKREEMNPTGSFKARGFSVAVSLLKERGIQKAAVNSNGNAASALAAYAAHAGIEAYVFVPRDCPGLIVAESLHYGARTYLVDGLIHDAGRVVELGMNEQGWTHVGTLREPGRAEGKKTMGLELAEQLGWSMPDTILYPTGGGSGVIGLWRAFVQLRELGWVKGDLPRLVSVQERSCQPIVKLINPSASGETGNVEKAPSPTGLRVPDPPDGELIAAILRSSGGTAIAVDTGEIHEAQKQLAEMGLSASPEGAAAWAGLVQLAGQGYFNPNETVVWFNTSHEGKYWPYNVDSSIPLIESYEDFKRKQRS
jgi:threonine synthase